MGNYKSDYTGKQIDGVIGTFLNKGLTDVNGYIVRDDDNEGQFTAGTSLAEVEDGTDLSLVTTGEKYYWNDLYRQKGQPSGIAQLNESGTVPSTQLPSYVDDVVEVATFGDLPRPGETGKIYVTLNDNLTYRWGGTEYVEISKSLALGETFDTAYQGDRGKIAYDHATSDQGAACQMGLYKFETGAEGHVTGTSAVEVSDISAFMQNSQSAVTITPATTSLEIIDSVGQTNTPTIIDTTKFDGGSIQFIQDENEPTHFTLQYNPSHPTTGFYTAGSAATMPTKKTVSGLWNGYDTTNTYAAAQEFVAKNS